MPHIYKKQKTNKNEKNSQIETWSSKNGRIGLRLNQETKEKAMKVTIVEESVTKNEEMRNVEKKSEELFHYGEESMVIDE